MRKRGRHDPLKPITSDSWLVVRNQPSEVIESQHNMARDSEARATSLPPKYWTYARVWFWLGVPAFLSVIVVFWLMVAKPG